MPLWVWSHSPLHLFRDSTLTLFLSNPSRPSTGPSTTLVGAIVSLLLSSLPADLPPRTPPHCAREAFLKRMPLRTRDASAARPAGPGEQRCPLPSASALQPSRWAVLSSPGPVVFPKAATTWGP